MKIHHIGYLVDDIARAEKGFVKLGYTRKGDVTEDTARGVYILFLSNDNYVVELIQPVDENSPMYGLRKKHRNSPYHICYAADDLQSKINELIQDKEDGYVLVQPPQPAPAIQGRPDVAFLLNRDVGMIELVETAGEKYV
jgi:methylmalonyl-CoA/ethylmalonyl-CoA epimerase